MSKLKKRVEQYQDWVARVSQILDSESDEMIYLSDVLCLAEEAKSKAFPTNSKFYEQLEALVEDMKEDTDSVNRRHDNSDEHPRSRESISILKKSKADLLRRQSNSNNNNNYSEIDLADMEGSCMIQTKRFRRNL